VLARFQREARLAMRLKHPNVVRTFQVGEAGGLRYLVMEYLEGETLDEVLQRRRQLPPLEAARLVHQALLGLQHLHEQGMVHRDLKPANLMLVPATGAAQPQTTLDATLKILDIGLGRALFDEGAPGAGNQVDLTTQGEMLGAPEYMAPEQARDSHSADVRADIYALGCVLYHALAGKPPFVDKNLVRLVVRQATENPRPLKEFNAAVPDGLQQVVNWMLAKDPGQRYPTPDRAAQALQVFLLSDAPPGRGPAAEPRMQAYLSWLEVNNQESAPAPAAATQPAPAPPPRPPTLAEAPPAAKPAPKPAPAGAGGPRSAIRNPPPSTNPDHPVADVELVPLGPSRGAEPSEEGWSLSRRDWLMIGIGALGVLVGEGIGWLMARFLRRRVQGNEPPPPETPGNPEEKDQ
jgi:serine/threonine protein kinase